MDRRVVFLHAPVVAAAEEVAVAVEERRTDRNAALGHSLAGFVKGDLEELVWVDVGIHYLDFIAANAVMLISNSMLQQFQPGDFLVFQLEAGFALLRVLGVDEDEYGITWHVAAYSDFFPDVDAAEVAIATHANLKVSTPHLALSDRAFASTQVARLSNSPLTEAELTPLEEWRPGTQRIIHERSIRLLLGLR